MLVAAFDMQLHAAVTVDGRDRRRLERLCRYFLRPPFAQDAVQRTPDGNVRLTFKAPRRSGATYAEMTPDTFLARLCALVPPPRVHLIKYFGVLTRGPIATRSALASCPPARRSRPLHDSSRCLCPTAAASGPPCVARFETTRSALPHPHACRGCSCSPALSRPPASPPRRHRPRRARRRAPSCPRTAPSTSRAPRTATHVHRDLIARTDDSAACRARTGAPTYGHVVTVHGLEVRRLTVCRLGGVLNLECLTLDGPAACSWTHPASLTPPPDAPPGGGFCS